METNRMDQDASFSDREVRNATPSRPATRDEVAYRDGYVQGKSVEQLQQRRMRAREADIYATEARVRENNGASGVLIGFLLALIAAVIGGILYFANDDAGNVQPVDNQPPATETPTQDTTIIERTIDRTQEIVPVPVTPSEPAGNGSAPAQPEAETAPADTTTPGNES
jgi:hypothetical protein